MCVCVEHYNAVVYILSNVLLKILRSFSFSTSDSFTLLASSGLIGPRRTYHEPATHNAVRNLGKKRKSMAKLEPFYGNCPSLRPFRNSRLYICQYINRVVIDPSFF